MDEEDDAEKVTRVASFERHRTGGFSWRTTAWLMSEDMAESQSEVW